MKAPFAPPFASTHEKIKQMHEHCKSIDDENKGKQERLHCSPIVDNIVLLSALDQRCALLEALEEATLDLWYQVEAKHGSEVASKYPSIVKSKAAIKLARGE